ncbi:hypothetical protein DNAOFDDG_02001 [Mannheimia haemolytica]|uniref:Uncharacterized protein n=1 Tax=Mannheimia haemolytica TaxID=75985 RepID=A0A378N9U3_MANHA|nr:hypothetical protein J450_01605 [Mannheimia haemolytica D171]TCS83447.1 hypothetical protein EDC41_1501 [Mannheimia haemolytica]STY65222.1 Uncharacterised protein [Mannheimia haemolytica]STY85463.1 Uncharacterised protein [Mannheimia haemolytica]STY91695.1 Uncharacterised protein [Mannheimia haemolytica]
MKYAKIILFLTAFAISADYLELGNDCDGKICTAQR